MLLKFQCVYAEADFHNKILKKEILHSSQFFLQLRCRDQHWNLYAQTTLESNKNPKNFNYQIVWVCVHIDAKSVRVDAHVHVMGIRYFEL